MKSLMTILILIGLSASALTANASVNTHLPPDFYGAYTYDAGVPIPVSEGDVIAEGVLIDPNRNEPRGPWVPPGVCRTSTPITVGYRAEAGSGSHSVHWEFDENCRAVVTDISSTTEDPCEDSGRAQVIDLSIPATDPRFLLNMAPAGQETLHDMHACYEMTDWFGEPATKVWVKQRYSRWLYDDGTRDIMNSVPPTGECIDGPVGFWTLSCERKTPPAEYGTLSDGGIDKRLVSYAVGEYGYPAFLISYKMTAYVYDWAGQQEGSGDCELDGTAPPGWGETCTYRPRANVTSF